MSKNKNKHYVGEDTYPFANEAVIAIYGEMKGIISCLNDEYTVIISLSEDKFVTYCDCECNVPKSNLVAYKKFLLALVSSYDDIRVHIHDCATGNTYTIYYHYS